MSENLNGVLQSVEPQFKNLDLANGQLLDYRQECIFARQQITKNRFSIDTAARNPLSLKNAILNVAAIGISLNPAMAHAYLVPRDGGICLDISYRGLVKLATDSGAILWAKTELVYENDTFKWKGVNEAPEHSADPFGDRGEVQGGYCQARLHDGSVMVEVMPIEEIYKVRDTSKAFQKGKGPWCDWPEEMMKKTVTKRASKSWPQTENRHRVDKAIEVLNEHEGAAYSLEQQSEFQTLIEKGDVQRFYLYCASLDGATIEALYNSFQHGEKTKLKEAGRELYSQGVQWIQELAIDVMGKLDEGGSPEDLFEIYEGLPEKARALLYNNLRPEHQEVVDGLDLPEYEDKLEETIKAMGG